MELAEKEVHRTHWQPGFLRLAELYLERLQQLRARFVAEGQDLVAAFAKLQNQGRIEIITSAATHALLPLLQQHPPSIRAQILVARDEYRRCFGRDPRGSGCPNALTFRKSKTCCRRRISVGSSRKRMACCTPNRSPRYGLFAPIFTPNGIAVFGRDFDSARQVWSKEEGYPGEPVIGTSHRDIGFHPRFRLSRAVSPCPTHRSFTGIKDYAITGGSGAKLVYNPDAAMEAADRHADHFLRSEMRQVTQLAEVWTVHRLSWIAV